MSKKLITVITAIALIGFGTFAFAHWNGGYGHIRDGCTADTECIRDIMGDRGPGYGYQGNLNEDQIKALENEQAAFLKATEAIRQDLYSKQLALESELAKSDPDTAKAAALQKDISKLEAQLDQMRIDHMIKARKIDPDAGRGFAAMGPMMGYGGQYPGSCWRSNPN